MKYKDILKTIAEKENKTCKEIEREMKRALKEAKINCSLKKFIKQTATSIRDYI